MSILQYVSVLVKMSKIVHYFKTFDSFSLAALNMYQPESKYNHVSTFSGMRNYYSIKLLE